MKIRINVKRSTHEDEAGHVYQTIEPSNYVNAQTVTRVDRSGNEFARVNIRPAGRAAAKQHGIL